MLPGDFQKWCEALSSRSPGGAKLPQGGVPPLGSPETPLTQDNSGSSSSNERFLKSSNTFFSVDYDGISSVAAIQRDHRK